MSWFMVDVEADGPIPGDYSMISFGAVRVTPGLEETFYATLRPISDSYVEKALSVSGFSREETLAFPDPNVVMEEFREWVGHHTKGQPMFISDNNGFDWQFVNWYFHHFLGENPFGHQFDEPGVPLQGNRTRLLYLLQTPTKNETHAQCT